MEIKKTSLYQLHKNNNAKFVEFAGYEMPIQYDRGIIEEHKFTREYSGILMYPIWANYLFMEMRI